MQFGEPTPSDERHKEKGFINNYINNCSLTRQAAANNIWEGRQFKSQPNTLQAETRAQARITTVGISDPYPAAVVGLLPLFPCVSHVKRWHKSGALF